MRTTIELPDDLHRAALQMARDRHQTLSRTVADLVRTAMIAGPAGAAAGFTVDPETGMPLVTLARPIDAEDVARAQDEQ